MLVKIVQHQCGSKEMHTELAIIPRKGELVSIKHGDHQHRLRVEDVEHEVGGLFKGVPVHIVILHVFEVM